MPDLSRVPRRLGALWTRFGNVRRPARSRPPDRSPRTLRSPRQLPPPEVDLTAEWIRIGAHVERRAPADVPIELLCRVEDAAAEHVFQRSRRGQLAR